MQGFEDIFTQPPFQHESGVWAIVDRDHYDSITMVYPSELDALRVLNGRGYGTVKFIPWGKSLSDLAFDEEANR